MLNNVKQMFWVIYVFHNVLLYKSSKGTPWLLWLTCMCNSQNETVYDDATFPVIFKRINALIFLA